MPAIGGGRLVAAQQRERDGEEEPAHESQHLTQDNDQALPAVGRHGDDAEEDGAESAQPLRLPAPLRSKTAT